jgi:hypothetical protein
VIDTIWPILFYVGVLGGALVFLCFLGLTILRALRQPFPAVKQALLSSVVTAASGGLIAWLAVAQYQSYGIALFIGLPIYAGVLSSLLYGYREPRTPMMAAGVASLTLVFLGGIVILMALDGILCILMASPLAFAGAWLAAYLTNGFLQRRHSDRAVLPLLVACASLPFLVGFESRSDLPPPTSTVVTSIDIDASPETVWKFIPAIPRISGPLDMMFQLGIAYPVCSDMIGSGMGATRHCVLSTGPLVETITAWEPGELLRFDVTHCPPSMHEISIYPNLHPAHLDNFMVSQTGEFRLVRLGPHRTRLIGTSVYYNRMWPAWYWLRISDYIVHRVHLRVFNFVSRKPKTIFPPIEFPAARSESGYERR